MRVRVPNPPEPVPVLFPANGPVCLADLSPAAKTRASSGWCFLWHPESGLYGWGKIFPSGFALNQHSREVASAVGRWPMGDAIAIPWRGELQRWPIAQEVLPLEQSPSVFTLEEGLVDRLVSPSLLYVGGPARRDPYTGLRFSVRDTSPAMHLRVSIPSRTFKAVLKEFGPSSWIPGRIMTDVIFLLDAGAQDRVLDLARAVTKFAHERLHKRGARHGPREPLWEMLRRRYPNSFTKRADEAEQAWLLRAAGFADQANTKLAMADDRSPDHRQLQMFSTPPAPSLADDPDNNHAGRSPETPQ